jgi:hypothetical protein
MPQDLEQKIAAAFLRSATLDADRIQVTINGHKAILKGQVRSFAELEDAENTIGSAPEILEVDNQPEVVDREVKPALTPGAEAACDRSQKYRYPACLPFTIAKITILLASTGFYHNR